MKTEDFIKKCNTIHNNFYDYSKTKYIKAHENVIIVCPIHGEFTQKAYTHKQGSGCFDCGKLKKANSKTINQKDYIDACVLVHKDFYDYSKTKYTKNYNKFIVTCPFHGDFKITANDHKQGKGCRICGIEKNANKRKIDTKEFIKRSREKHLNKYDYSKSLYIHCREYITIICPFHGKFEQIAYYHMSGNGCRKCNESIGEAKIACILDSINVEYVREWDGIINEKTNSKLFFDFYLPEYNFVIEFDGIQHFKPVSFYIGQNSQESLLYNRERDSLKNRLLTEAGIRFKRIPYTQINRLEKIIHEEIRRLQKQASN